VAGARKRGGWTSASATEWESCAVLSTARDEIRITLRCSKYAATSAAWEIRFRADAFRSLPCEARSGLTAGSNEAISCTSRGKSSGPPGVGSAQTSSSRKSRVSSWIRQGVGREVERVSRTLVKRCAGLINAGRRDASIPPGPPARAVALAFVGALEGAVIALAGQAPHDEVLAARAAAGVLGLDSPPAPPPTGRIRAPTRRKGRPRPERRSS